MTARCTPRATSSAPAPTPTQGELAAYAAIATEPLSRKDPWMSVLTASLEYSNGASY